MWALEQTEQFEKDTKHYAKKHPRELGAVLGNLDRYLKILKVAPNSLAVKAGFLHTEPDGVLAIDQKRGGPGLQETRLYIFTDDSTETVWLITIGNKDEQSKDIQFCRKFVDSLKNNEV